MTEENESRSERTRTEIITSAHQLFLERGFHGTSMRQIAQNAGIALGGIYNHFSNKEDLFVAVLKVYHPYHEIFPALQEAHGDTLESYVHNAAHTMIATLDKRPDFLNLMFIEIVEFNSQHLPQLFDMIYPQFVTVLQTLSQHQPSLRSIPSPIIIRTFIGLFFSYYMTKKLIGNNSIPVFEDQALEYFVDIFLHGIVIQPSV